MPSIVFPVLHGAAGYPSGYLHSNWTPQPTVIVGILGLIAAYVAWTGPLNRRRPDAALRPVSTAQKTYFIAGAIAFLIALGPPLDDWSDHYLLSAHMFQHLILIFVVAPLWLAGTPSWFFAPILKRPLLAKIGYQLTRPAAAFAISNLIITFWHLPGPYNSALNNEMLHVVQHIMVLGAAILAWWAILSPLPAWPRLSPLLQCLYLFFETLPGGAIGAFITLAGPGVYSFYDNVPRIWGIDLEMDQEFAGLMMWVGSSLIYLLWITVIFFQWAAKEEEKETTTRRPSTARGQV